MRLDFLITVKTIVEKGSFALAAKATNITPSAVSMQVKTVEQYFEKALFHRAGQSVTPTPFALELCDRVGPLLEEIEQLRGGYQASVSGRVKLGTISIMQPIVLPPLFKRLKELAPQLEVDCIPGRSQDLIEAVKQGELDAAIVAEPENASRRQLDWQLLYEVPFSLITPRKMPSGNDRPRLDELPWIAYDRSTSLGKVSRCLSRTVFGARPAALELQSLEGVISMVASGYGAAVVILPDPQLKHYDIDITSLGDDVPSLCFSLVSRKIENKNKPISILKDVLRKHYTQETTSAADHQ